MGGVWVTPGESGNRDLNRAVKTAKGMAINALAQAITSDAIGENVKRARERQRAAVEVFGSVDWPEEQAKHKTDPLAN